MKVTLQDIARELDVSAATVSMALRGDPLINPETRSRVNEVALQLNYRGSSGRPARATGKPERNALGLLLSGDGLAKTRTDANLAQMMEGIMAEADRRGYLVNIHAVRSDETCRMADDPAAVPALVRDDVCQAIIVRGRLNAQDVAYIANQMPVVSLGRAYREANVDTVLSNNMEGVRSLVTRLWDAGHRRMAWVGSPGTSSFFEERQAGFVMGCLGAGLDLHGQLFFGEEIFENFRRSHRIGDAASLLAAVRGGTTALVCGNDSVATHVIAALEGAGLRVPQDVSVTGFDAAPASSPGYRQITSVDPDFVEMGRAAVRLVVQHLEQPDLKVQTVVVQGEIVPGETDAPAKT